MAHVAASSGHLSSLFSKSFRDIYGCCSCVVGMKTEVNVLSAFCGSLSMTRAGYSPACQKASAAVNLQTEKLVVKIPYVLFTALVFQGNDQHQVCR